MAQEDTNKHHRLDELITERLAEKERQPKPVPETPAPADSVRKRPALSADEEKERYSEYYEKIYPLLRSGKLPFERIAEQTGMRERRLRESLLFRLGSGEVMQLFGRKIGYCYLCKKRMDTRQTSEPVCLVCLDEIISHLDTPAPPTASEKAPVPAANQDAEAPPDTVSREQYQALLEELQFYKNKLQEICLMIGQPMPEQPASPASPPPAPEPPATAPAFETGGTTGQTPGTCTEPDLLGLLELDDSDIPLFIGNDSQDFSNVLSQEPLRHFGFQRLKPYQRKGA